MSSRRNRLLAAAATVAGAVVALLVASQLFLPGIVAADLRSSLAPYASGVRLSLRASPAIELLAGRADDLELSIDQLHAHGRANVAALLQRAEATTNADVSVARLVTPQGVEFSNVTMRKRGSSVAVSAAIARSAIQAALPHGITIDPGAGPDGQLGISASLDFLGHRLSASGLLEARDGSLEVVPSSALIPPLKLFGDPRISIDGLHLKASGGLYVFSAYGHLI